MQELSWASTAFKDVLGTVPGFLIDTFTPTSTLATVASGDGFIPISPTVVLTHRSKNLSHVLMTHAQGVVVVTGAAIPRDFSSLFKTLSTHHFVFLTLGQVWAKQ